jgi:hypothetical protein
MSTRPGGVRLDRRGARRAAPAARVTRAAAGRRPQTYRDASPPTRSTTDLRARRPCASTPTPPAVSAPGPRRAPATRDLRDDALPHPRGRPCSTPRCARVARSTHLGHDQPVCRTGAANLDRRRPRRRAVASRALRKERAAPGEGVRHRSHPATRSRVRDPSSPACSVR